MLENWLKTQLFKPELGLDFRRELEFSLKSPFFMHMNFIGKATIRWPEHCYNVLVTRMLDCKTKCSPAQQVKFGLLTHELLVVSYL